MRLRNKIFTIFALLSFVMPFLIQIQLINAAEIIPKDIHLSWQNDPTTTMTMSWRTVEETDSIVQYGPDTTYGNEKLGTSAIFHAVEITGLTPDTTYHYRVGDGDTWSADYTFKTGTLGNHVRFLDVGDCQNRPANGRIVRDAMTRIPTDLITFTGDLCDTPTIVNEWYNWFSAYTPLISNYPLMTVIGNHEKNNSLFYDYFALPGKEYSYSFNYGNVHFAILDTLWVNPPVDNMDEQAAWLIEDLEANQDYDWTIVLMHRPPFSSFQRYWNGEYDQINETFVPIFESYNVDLVITGHEHVYQRLAKNNITYIISGGGGSPLLTYNPYYAIPESVYVEATFNFLYFDIYEDKLNVIGFRPDYSYIDQFVINKENKADLSFITPPYTFNELWNETLEIPIIIKNTGEQDILVATQGEYTTYEGTTQFEIPPLAVNENYTFNIDFSVNTTGTFTLEIDLDLTDQIDEVIEDNNNLLITFNALEIPKETSFFTDGVWAILAILSTLMMVSIITMRKKISRK